MFRPTPIPPEPGQESVWDYPRPPRLERVSRRLRVVLGGVTVADTWLGALLDDEPASTSSRSALAGWRVLETSHPPTYYFPPEAIAEGVLGPPRRVGICEWKGRAVLFDVRGGGKHAQGAAWAYPDPSPAFRDLANAVAFYAGPMDACFVGEVRAEPQHGGFYGGWITPDVAGPFKGGPGTMGW